MASLVARSPPADFVAPALRAHKPLALIRHRHLGPMALGRSGCVRLNRWRPCQHDTMPRTRADAALPGLGGGLGSDFTFVRSVTAAITGSLSYDNGEAARGIATGQYRTSTPSQMAPQILHLDPQAGLDSNDANDASRAGDLRRAASAEADTLPSSSGMPTLRCRLSGEPTIGSGMWRPHVIRASEPSRARVSHRSMLHFLRSVKGVTRSPYRSSCWLNARNMSLGVETINSARCPMRRSERLPSG